MSGKKVLLALLVTMTVMAGLLFTIFKNSTAIRTQTEDKLHSNVVDFLKTPAAAEGLSTIKDPEFIKVEISGDNLVVTVPVTNVAEDKAVTEAALFKVLSEWIKNEFPSKPPTLKVEILQ